MATASRLFVLRDEINCRQLYAFLKANWPSMAAAGKPLALTAQEYKSKRSIEQNKRYWAILNEIAEGAWMNGKSYSAEAWAEFFKRKLIGTEELPDGSSVGISTTTLNVEEFAAYMTRVEVFAATELGVELS